MTNLVTHRALFSPILLRENQIQLVHLPLHRYGRSKFSKMQGRSVGRRSSIYILMSCTPLRNMWGVKIKNSRREHYGTSHMKTVRRPSLYLSSSAPVGWTWVMSIVNSLWTESAGPTCRPPGPCTLHRLEVKCVTYGQCTSYRWMLLRHHEQMLLPLHTAYW